MERTKSPFDVLVTASTSDASDEAKSGSAPEPSSGSSTTSADIQEAFAKSCKCNLAFTNSNRCEKCNEKLPKTQELNLDRFEQHLTETGPLFGNGYSSDDEMPVYRSVAMFESSQKFSPRNKDSSYPEKIECRFSFTKRPVNTLFWKFSKYPVSLKHGFSSCGLSRLYTRIEEALCDLEIDYKFDGAALLYVCEKTEKCVCNSFTVIVSKLQKSCQDELGYQYVIELCLLGGATCPTVWDRLTNRFFEATKDVISCPRKGTRGGQIQLADGFDESKTKDRKVEGNEVLANFIDFLYPADVDETTVRMAEVFAELTCPSRADYNEKWLRPKDIEKLIALIDRGDRNLSRCVCTVLRHVAQAGVLQFISEESLENLLKALVRLLTMVDTSDVFLLELQREAMRALIGISKFHKPTGFVKAMAETVMKRCTTSSDDRLSGYAGQALNMYVQ